jgi:hypothetical protein
MRCLAFILELKINSLDRFGSHPEG